MAVEIAGALLIGLLVLWLVFEPALFPGRSGRGLPEQEAPEETRRGIALLSLKEIEFDRATGKLSDADYETLKSRYASEALASYTGVWTSEIRSAAPANAAVTTAISTRRRRRTWR